MKKSLLAVAALSAIAGAAQAQSSVTIYGVLDAGYINQKSDGTSTNARAQSTNSSFGQSAEQTSRLGFKGTEDLGGGASAFFACRQRAFYRRNRAHPAAARARLDGPHDEVVVCGLLRAAGSLCRCHFRLLS